MRDRIKKSIDAMGRSVESSIAVSSALSTRTKGSFEVTRAREFDAVNDDAVNDAKESESESENATRRGLVLRRSSTAKTRRRTTSANVGKVRKARRRLGRNEI